MAEGVEPGRGQAREAPRGGLGPPAGRPGGSSMLAHDGSSMGGPNFANYASQPPQQPDYSSWRNPMAAAMAGAGGGAPSPAGMAATAEAFTNYYFSGGYSPFAGDIRDSIAAIWSRSSPSGESVAAAYSGGYGAFSDSSSGQYAATAAPSGQFAANLTGHFAASSEMGMFGTAADFPPAYGQQQAFNNYGPPQAQHQYSQWPENAGPVAAPLGGPHGPGTRGGHPSGPYGSGRGSSQASEGGPGSSGRHRDKAGDMAQRLDAMRLTNTGRKMAESNGHSGSHGQSKKMSWASVASQPAKPQSIAPKPKKPGVLPAPAILTSGPKTLPVEPLPESRSPEVPSPLDAVPPLGLEPAAPLESVVGSVPGPSMRGRPPPAFPPHRPSSSRSPQSRGGHSNVSGGAGGGGGGGHSKRSEMNGPNHPHPRSGGFGDKSGYSGGPRNQRHQSMATNGGGPSAGPVPMPHQGGYPDEHHRIDRLSSANQSGNQTNPVASSSPGSKNHPILECLKSQNEYNPKTFDLNPKNARFFVIKSFSEDDIHRSIKYEIWCSTDHGNKRLDAGFKERQGKGPVYLLFSVNGSGHFCGMAEMLTGVDYNTNGSVWVQDKFKGQFKVKWIYVKDVPNGQLRHIRLENNENKPVTNSRDTQEVPHDKGKQVLKIMHSYKHQTSIFDDFIHYEKRQEEEAGKKIMSSASQSGSFKGTSGGGRGESNSGGRGESNSGGRGEGNAGGRSEGNGGGRSEGNGGGRSEGNGGGRGEGYHQHSRAGGHHGNGPSNNNHSGRGKYKQQHHTQQQQPLQQQQGGGPSNRR